VPQKAATLKRRPAQQSNASSSALIIKAYRKNLDSDEQKPDLAISAGTGNWFFFAGKDVEAGKFNDFKNPSIAGKLPSLCWDYERLEVYGDGQALSFVMPTVSKASNDAEHHIAVGKGKRGIRTLQVWTHMMVLNGLGQGSGDSSHTTTGLKVSLFVDHGSVRVYDGVLGTSGKWKPDGKFPKFADWCAEISDKNYEDKDGDYLGPLLMLASAGTALGNATLGIRVDPHAKSFLLTFPNKGAISDFKIRDSQANEPSGLKDVRAAAARLRGDYRVTQRASGAWVDRRSSEEWQVAFETGNIKDIPWNQSRDSYLNALRTVRPVNRVTLIPSMQLKTPLPKFNLGLAMLIRRAPEDNHPLVAKLDDLSFAHAALRPAQKSDGQLSAKLTFDLLGPKMPNINYDASIDAPKFGPDQQPDGSFEFIATIDTAGSKDSLVVRIGSLDLTFGGNAGSLDQDFKLTLLAESDSQADSPKIPDFEATMKLPISHVVPGGQDGLPSSEYVPENFQEATNHAEVCMEGRFTGNGPVVIPVGDEKDGDHNKNDGSYLLNISESNPDLYSQTVFLKLDYVRTAGSASKDTAPQVAAESPANSHKPRVIVIDSDPFLVAAIDYPRLQPNTSSGTASSNTVALWSTGELGGAAWQLKTDAQPFDMILPPQGIGEEMPKAKELDKKDPEDPNQDLKTLDFRFSPPARQQLQASYTPQNFTEAPWNLRRILGYPGQRDAGAGVVQLNYELLYGLSCSVDAPLLRLAETFSIVGRIAGRIRRFSFPQDRESPIAFTREDAEKAFAQRRWNWSLYAELYSKRIALLELRASGSNYGSSTGAAGASAAPEVFTVSQGVECTFRGKADLFYSVDPDKVASVPDDHFPTADPQDKTFRGLKGGVSWPFESPRLFHATVRNPKSSSGVVSGLALSPVGGTGTVKSGFDKDLSTVTSVTEIGRSSKISVARLGRIGVYHNLARYVIEYERDTSPSVQFAGSQTNFYNRPVLRKVREFVEILEPVATLSVPGQPYPGAGCVKSIEFKRTVILVTSRWSSNVGDNGWKIPLWYEPDSHVYPGNEFAYPLPTVVFNLAGADGGDVECAIKTVDKLFFYTETDAAADPDPHKWPVVPGVDFLAVPRPSQNSAFPSSNINELPAYDPPLPFGLAAFTHELDAGHGRINLVNGRSEQAIGSNLSNLTLQRAPEIPDDLAKTIPGFQNIQDLQRSVRTDLFDAIRTGKDIVAAVKSICDPTQNPPTGLVAALAKLITDKVEDLKKGVQAQETILLQKFVTQVKQEIDLLADELKQQFRQAKDIIGHNIQDAQDKVHKAILECVMTEVDAFQTRVNGLPISANALAQFLSRVCDALQNANDTLEQTKGELLDALDQVSNTVNSDAATIKKNIQNAVDDLKRPLESINSLLAQVRTQVLARAENWMPGASFICQQWEKTIGPGIALVQAVLSKAEAVLSVLKTGTDEEVEAAAKAVNDPLKDVGDAVLKICFPGQFLGSAVDDAKKDAGVVQNYINGLSDTIDGAVDRWVTDAAKQANITIIVGETEIDTLVDAVVQQILAQFDITDPTKAFGPVLKAITDKAAMIATELKGYLADLTTESCVAAKNLLDAAGAASDKLEALRRALEDSLSHFVESIVPALPKLDIPLPSARSLPVLLNRAFGSVPAIPNLGFSLPNAAYFYAPQLPNVNLTPLLTQVKDLVPNLSPLGSMLPSLALSDRMLPVPSLPNFDLNHILPDFAGLKLDNLFPALKMPAGSSDAVKITHGLDQASRTAWVQADIDLKTDTASIFSIGPMSLQIVTPRFTAQVRAQAGANGQASKQATGQITGDWQLIIGGSPMITLTNTSLTYDKDGKLHVNVSPDRVQLSQALSFIQQIIASYSSPDSGFGIYPSATGIETRLSLPIPDTSAGTTGISNLTFNFLFGLSWANDFEIYTGFGLASPNAPFNISVFILGGGGHLVASARYRPFSASAKASSLTCSVDMALDASAALAIALGPIKGSVHINLGFRFIFNSGQGDLSLGIFLLIGGEVSILSIVSASVLLRLEATYANGAFNCHGLFSISIKICWCFTLSVSEEISCRLGSGGGIAYNESPRFPWSEASDSYLALGPTAISTVPPPSELQQYPELAKRYLHLIS
jgi:ElaB/YqjD/DUF883 family membrane-anchored ribosome-binding protein